MKKVTQEKQCLGKTIKVKWRCASCMICCLNIKMCPCSQGQVWECINGAVGMLNIKAYSNVLTFRMWLQIDVVASFKLCPELQL